MKKRLLATIPVLLVVFLCTSFPVFANQTVTGDYYRIENYWDSTHNVRCEFVISEFNKEIVDMVLTTNPSSSVQASNNYVLFTVYLYNDTDTDALWDDSNFIFTMTTLPLGTVGGVDYYNAYKITEIYPLSEYNALIPCIASSVNSSWSLLFQTDPKYCYNNHLVVPAHSKLVTQFMVVIQGTTSAGSGMPSLPSDDFELATVYSNFNSKSWSLYPAGSCPVLAVEYGLRDANNKLAALLEAYNNQTNISKAQDVTNESSTLINQSNSVHSQESSYYTQTNTALSNTGLSNFSFSQNVIGGLGKTKDHFTYVWNKLGDYKDVYLFSMTLAIALMIIRHVRPIRRKKEE